jgi:hypothetical protein
MSLSSSASAQVQAILEAAENSAKQIKREAEAEAEKIRGAARESKQEDLSGVLAAVASLRKDLDTLEARLKELQGPPPAPAPAPAPEPAAIAQTADGDDTESARLIALNMALNGESREETDKYLAENFELGDRAALLDEVYATVEG